MKDFSTKCDERRSRNMENVGGNSMTLSSREKKRYDRHRADFRETQACSMPFVVKDSYTKLHENPTNGLVATVRRRQTDRQTDRHTDRRMDGCVLHICRSSTV